MLKPSRPEHVYPLTLASVAWARPLALVAAVMLWLSCQGGPEPTGSVVPLELKTEEERTMYAAGLLLGRSLGPLSPNATELALIHRGLTDGALGLRPAVDVERYRPQVRETMLTRQGVAALRERERGVKWLDQAAGLPRAQRLPSGLIYVEDQPGGARPGAAERVRVRYQTTLASGEVVDQSQAQAAREVALDKAPPCLREGLLRLGVGGRARLYCPAVLAYGERGQPPQIPAQAALLFTVELLAIAER